MSIEIVLVPLAVAAISAWQANRKTEGSGQVSVVVTTRMKHAGLLASALQDLGAEVARSDEVIAAVWPGMKTEFTRGQDGVWRAHFAGEVSEETATTVVRDLDRAYGLRVQQEVLHRVRARAPEVGMTLESETVEEDRSVTLILNVER